MPKGWQKDQQTHFVLTKQAASERKFQSPFALPSWLHASAGSRLWRAAMAAGAERSAVWPGSAGCDRVGPAEVPWGNAAGRAAEGGTIDAVSGVSAREPGAGEVLSGVWCPPRGQLRELPH